MTPPVSERGFLVRAIPGFLKGWIALHVLGFAIGPFLNPRPDRISAGSLIFWALVEAAIGYAMFRHSKLGWIFALVLAVLGAVGGLGIFSARDTHTSWYFFGLIQGVLELALLLSPSARSWIREPTVRRWDP